MAVFTPVSLDDLTHWLTKFSLGKPLAIKGISSGIENSNFFLTTETGEYVLTIFEKLGFEELPFYLHLMRHLAGIDRDPARRRIAAVTQAGTLRRGRRDAGKDASGRAGFSNATT